MSAITLPGSRADSKRAGTATTTGDWSWRAGEVGVILTFVAPGPKPVTTKQLVLAGGGHSHALVLRLWAMHPKRRPLA